jgi:hypothetical protein
LFLFKLEILHKTLPTIKSLIYNHPTLLPPNLNCLYCNQLPKNITHLFSCQANPNLYSILWSTIHQSIISQISNWYASLKTAQIIQQLQSLFNNTPPVTLAAGLIPSSLINSICPIFTSHKKPQSPFISFPTI